MANVDRPCGFRAVKNLAGGFVPVLTGTTKSNLTLAAGDALIITTTGLLDIALSSSAAIYGVAQESVTAVAATRQSLKYVPAMPNIVFSGQCSGTAAQTDFGEAIDIEGTTGIMELNEDANSTGVAMPIQLEGNPRNAIGANARLEFVWNKSSFGGGA